MIRGADRPVLSFLRLAAPMIISRAGLAGMSIADGIMVAQYSPTQLAVQGLAEGTMGRLLDVSFALVMGGIALASQMIGSGTPELAGGVWRRAVVLGLLSGAVCLALGMGGAWWLRWAGEAPQLASATGAVTAVLGLGMPAGLVAVASAVFLEAVGRAPVVAVAVVAANILNVCFNLLLIGGMFGLPALGALGCALSTSLVRVLLAIGLVSYTWFLSDLQRLGVAGGQLGFASSVGRQQTRLGYATATTASVMNLLGISLVVLTGWLGTIPLAAISALWNMMSIGALFALGIADATALRVAGGGKPSTSRPRDAAAIGFLLALPILALPAGLVTLAPEPFAALYGSDIDIRQSLGTILPLGGLVMLSDAASFISAAALRGLGDMAWPAVIQAAVAAILVAAAWWLAIGHGQGAPGVVEAMLATSLLRAILLSGRFHYITRLPERRPNHVV